MSAYFEQLEFITPVNAVATGGVAQLITTPNSPNPFEKREFLLIAPASNINTIVVSSTQADAQSGNGIELPPREILVIEGTVIQSREVEADISNLWFTSAQAGDQLVIAYKERSY